MASPTPRRVRLAPELALSAHCYGDPSSPAALCLHGWMDNWRTYDRVGPALAAAGLYAVCVDLPGHGGSDHLPASAHYLPTTYAAHALDAADALGLGKFWLVGHSLGAGLVAVLAGALPERVVGLVMLEGLGPSVRPAADAPSLFARGAAVGATAGAARRRAGGSTYASVADAVAQRLATVTRYQGAQTLSSEAAEALVRGALVEVGSGGAAHGEGGGGGWRFTHDRRIVGPYLSYWHEEHVAAFLRGIRCPTLVLAAAGGWPRDEAVMSRRMAALREGVTGDGGSAVVAATTPGGHHWHLDPDTAPAVCALVAAFVSEQLRGKGAGADRVSGGGGSGGAVGGGGGGGVAPA